MGTPGDVYYFYERRFRTQLIVGLSALARLLKPGRQRLSLVATLALGVVGAVLGGVVASLLGSGDIFELNASPSSPSSRRCCSSAPRKACRASPAHAPDPAGSGR